MAGTPLQLDDFSGGLTDFPVGADPRELMAAKNVVITVDRKPATRPGSLREAATDLAAKLPGPVNAMIQNFTPTGFPYKLSNISSAGRLYYFLGASHTELLGPEGFSLFSSTHAAAADKRFISSPWNDHQFITSASFTQKPQKIFVDSGGTLQLRTAGLPKPVGRDLVGLTYAATGYTYAWGYKYTYTAGNRTFIDRGPLQRFKADGVTPLISSAIAAAVTGMLGIGNFGVDNYDTASANLRIELYRTTLNGNIFYLVGDCANNMPVPSITDGLSDATLQTKQPHYTASGAPDFDPPPICKFVHVTERGIAIYGYIKDGSDEMKNRCIQSVVGDPDSVPGSFNFDVDEEVTGVSSFKGLPLIFTTKRVYRCEGQFDLVGSGQMTPRKIEDSVGCISHTSIVQTPMGVYFAGENGFYWTDGYSTRPISEKIRTRYATFYTGSAGRDMTVAYDENEKRVFWTFPETSNSDGIFVFHARFGLDRGGCFTQWGGEIGASNPESGCSPQTYPSTVNQNFRAKCLLAHNKRIYRGDDRGYAFFFDDSTKTDPRVVTSENMSAWGTTAISYDARLVALNFGTNFVRKLTTKGIFTFKNRGDMSVKISSDRNLEGRGKPLKEFRKRSQATWGMPGVLWGDPILWASEEALYEEVRMFPAGGLRCSYRSLWFQNAFTVVAKSDSMGLANLDGTAKTLTLLTGTWPADLRDLYIAFPNTAGEYVSKFLILSQSGAAVTLSDTMGALITTANTPWQLMGMAKGNIFELQSVVIPFQLLDSTQNVFRPGDSGGNE